MPPTTTEPPIVAPSQALSVRRWRGYENWVATVWLVGGLVCLILAACMHVGDNRRVYLPGASAPVPELCMLYSRWGIDCPGCGLTRTFIYMAHGHPQRAWQTNPIGCLVFAFVCVQIPMSATQVIFRQRNALVETWGRLNDWCIAGLLIALLLQWAASLIINH